MPQIGEFASGVWETSKLGGTGLIFIVVIIIVIIAYIIIVIIIIVIVTNLRTQGRSLQLVQNLLTYKPKASSKKNQRNDKTTK